MQSEYSKDTGPGSDATPTFAPPTQASSSPSISSAEDSPARMSARPENGREWNRELARVFGLSSPGSLGSFERSENPSVGFLLKTSQACLFPIAEKTDQSNPLEYPELLESWPDSGMWDVTEVYELKNSAPVTSGNESLSLPCWPTARGEDSESCGNHPNGKGDSLTGVTRDWPTMRSTSGGGNTSAYPGAPYRPATAQVAQELMASLWPTPDSPTGTAGPRTHRKTRENGHQTTIAESVEFWPTPDAATGGPNSNRENRERTGGPDLKEQSENWNTPHGMSNKDFRGKTGGCGGGEFAKQANQWPTPQERDFRSGETIAEYGNSRPLNESVVNWPTPHNTREHDSDNSDSTYLGRFLQGPDCPPLLQDPPIPDGPKSCETSPTSRRRLNPRFVEWLMGFPIGWTEPCSTAPGDSEDSETL